MKWVKDKTGRFAQRPHYLAEELDQECEHIILSFLRDRHGQASFPVATDDLTVLIESAVEDLDLYADLSQHDGDIEGITDFFPGKRPKVQISRHLSEAPNLENRLRTTLTHEYAHVRFHGFMFEIQAATLPLFSASPQPYSSKCKRENIVNAGQADWMEWQAGYSCGAFLIPIGEFRQVVKAFMKENDVAASRLGMDSPEGQGLISRTATAFRVSKDAARVRLLQKGVLVEDGRMLGKGLF
jgi:hypothetical protein